MGKIFSLAPVPDILNQVQGIYRRRSSELRVENAFVLPQMEEPFTLNRAERYFRKVNRFANPPRLGIHGDF